MSSAGRAACDDGCWGRCCCGRRGREERRLAAGQTYEPQTIIERRNWTLAAPLERASGVGMLTVPEESSAG